MSVGRLLVSMGLTAAFVCSIASAAEVIQLGTRLEPLVDDYLIESLQGARLVLHQPVPREVAIVHDQPWEGNTSAYHTVFQDGDVYRMYYRASDADEEKKRKRHPQFVCYAESKDGIHWTKPELGLVEFEGSKKNNIVLEGAGTHNFAPFRDARPDCPPESRYKALAGGKGGLFAYQSADGLRWSLMSDKPVITRGAFDSQNLAFWDMVRGAYRAYWRIFTAGVTTDKEWKPKGIRAIRTATSKDLLTWNHDADLQYIDSPPEQLYTNQIVPYFRAPHIFLGFPMRYMATRSSWLARSTSPGMNGITDGLFMTSRDGVTFHRWGEALIRPGPQKERGGTRNNLTAWGILQTRACLPNAPDELSIYSTEAYYWGPATRLRRFTVRMDGFVSVQAPARGGQMRTKLLSFDAPGGAGKIELVLNYSTSAAGSLQCEILDPSGKPVPGYALDDCPEIYGDELEHAVAWKGGSDLRPLAGRPIRLRFVLKDADLYSLRFQP